MKTLCPDLSDGQVQADRKWGPSVRIAQMREQIDWERQCERRGTFAPWPGAVWKNGTWQGGNPRDKWPA